MDKSSPSYWHEETFSGKDAAGASPVRTGRMRLRGARGHLERWHCGVGGGGEPACKPGSVVDSHSSGTPVARRLERPTRGHARAARRGREAACPSIWSCSGWGLPCHRCCHRRGALLPHHFNLTARVPANRSTRLAVYFLWHFPWARAPQALPGTLPYGARTFLPARERAERLPGRLPTGSVLDSGRSGGPGLRAQQFHVSAPPPPSAPPSPAPWPPARA